MKIFCSAKYFLAILFSHLTFSLYAQSQFEEVPDSLASFVQGFHCSVAFADVDGDNDQDALLTGNPSSGTFDPIATLYLNDGNGAFSEAVGTPFVGVANGEVAFADIDGDNDQDALIIGSTMFDSSTAKLYINDGDGNFTEVTTLIDGVDDGALAFADVNGDDTPDLVITGDANPGPTLRTTKLYVNSGGSFFEASPVAAPFDGVENGAVAFADIDGDNDQDLLITGLNTGSERIAKLYSNDGTGFFTEVTGTPFEGVEHSSIAFSDIDGDGDQDVLITGIAGISPPNSISNDAIAILYANDGNGNFTQIGNSSDRTPPLQPVLFGSVAFSDINGDGDLDLLITGDSDNNFTGRVANLYSNDGDGNYTEINGTPFEGVDFSSVAFADVDGNNTQDVLISGTLSGSTLYINLPICVDPDSDGVCIDEEIPGCQDPVACNFNPSATNPATCFYFDDLGVCGGNFFYDCPDIDANFGDPCDDGNPSTDNEVVQADCSCAPYECPILNANIGDPCDDGNPNTTNDIVQADCSCQGTQGPIDPIALSFDGIDDVVTIQEDISTSFGTGDFSVEFWIYLDDASSEGGIVGTFDIQDGGWAFHTASDQIFFYVATGASENDVDGTVFTFTPGNWIHLAGVRENNTINLYVDGVLVSSAPSNRSIPNTPLTLGRRYVDSNTSFESFKIDELRVWNFALNPNQINENLNCEITGNESGLVRYYRFNQGQPGADNTSQTSLVSNDLDNTVDGTISNFNLTGPISNFVQGANLDNCQGLDLTGYPTPPGSGDALVFDGVNDEVFIPHSDELSLTEFTLECWIKTTSNDDLGRFISKKNGGDQNYSLLMIGGKAHVRFDRVGSGSNFAEGTTDINDGKWHHIAGVHDTNSNTLRVYVDGILEGQQTGTGTPETSTQELAIGNWSEFASTSGFEGEIDEVRIWNSALSFEEIRDYMCQKDLSSHPSLSDLVAYYRFDDGAGSTTLTDLSGNNNNGTLSDMDPLSDWIISGAPIGDESEQVYISVPAGAGIIFESYGVILFGFDTTVEALHVYRVNEAPNNITVPAGYGSIDTSSYLGFFVVGGDDSDFTVRLFDDLNEQPDAGSLRIASRANNAGGAFQDVEGQVLSISEPDNTVTIQATNQENKEYIFGLTGTVDCPSLNLNIGDPCDDGDPNTSNDVVQSDCSCSGSDANLSLFFDGSNDQADIPADPTTDFGTGDFTVEFWMYLEDASTEFGGIAGTYNTSTGGWAFHTAFGQISFLVGTDASASLELISADLPVDEWVHVTGLRNNNTIELYLNGVLAISQASNRDIPNNDITLGRRYLNFNQFYESFRLEEFRVWNSALDEIQINETLNCEIVGDEPGLVRYYRFNQGQAEADNTAQTSLLSDDLDNPIDGTITNFALNGPFSNFVVGLPLLDCNIPVLGCTDPNSCDFDPLADTDDGSCLTFPGDPCDDGDPNTTDDILQADCSCQGTAELALFFDGVNDQVNISEDASTDFGTGDFTVEFWMYLDDTNTEFGGIASTFAVFQGGWAFHTAFNEINFIVGFDASDGTTYEFVTSSFNGNTWIHVAGVRENNELKLYMDGVLVDSEPSNRDIPNNPITLGRRYVDNVFYESFRLEEFRVWNFALNETQINNNLNCELIGDEPGLVRYYRFNQGQAEADNTAETALVSGDLDNPVDGSFANFALTGSISNFVDGLPLVECQPPVDCPVLGFNIGDPCDDGDPNTTNDIVQSDCSCAGTPTCANPFPAVEVSSLSSQIVGNQLILSWDPVPGQLGCNVQGRAAGSSQIQVDEVLIGANVGSFTQNITPVPPGNYEWRVRCGCSQNPPVVGPFTPWQPITIPASILTSNPNPTEGLSYVSFSLRSEGQATLEVFDMNGRLIESLFSGEASSETNYRFEFDGSSLPNGVYLYRLTTTNEVLNERFMIAR